MSGRDRLKIAVSITGRKLLSGKTNIFVLAGLILLLLYLWIEDSFFLSFRAFIYLCPFVFLFFSQDMMNDEINSGALENVLFVGGGFRGYLISKNAVVATSSLGVTLVLFSGFALHGLVTGQFRAFVLAQFAVAILVGAYYVALAGLLSLFFRAGSNVLIILLGQILLFVSLLFTASQRTGLAGRLANSSPPGIGAKLEFLSVSFMLPNMVIARRSWLNVLGLAAMTALLGCLQMWKIRSLELRKR